MNTVYVAGISTDEKTFWGYACGSSLALAALAAVHDHPTAFLLPLDGYERMDVVQVQASYGRAVEAACKTGCTYVPPSRIISIQHLTSLDLKRIIG